jgi:hypothetical protein
MDPRPARGTTSLPPAPHELETDPVNPYAADDTPTGPIHGLVPRTMEMPISKPLPPRLAWAMAELRPHLELMAARFRGLQHELDRVAGLLSKLQAQLDSEVQNAEALGL